jgi:hypothetical protein
MKLLTQRPFRCGQSNTALCFGFSGKQVGEPFCLCEIDASRAQRPAGEFARLGPPQARLGRKLGLDRGNDRASAVKVKLDKILARRSIRSGKDQYQGMV